MCLNNETSCFPIKSNVFFRSPPPIEYTMMPQGASIYNHMPVSLHYPSTASPTSSGVYPPQQASPSTSGVDYSSGQLGAHYSPPITNPLLHSPSKGVPPPLLSQYAARQIYVTLIFISKASLQFKMFLSLFPSVRLTWQITS